MQIPIGSLSTVLCTFSPSNSCIYKECLKKQSPNNKPIKTLVVYGGVSINPQMMALQGVDVLVAMPGRLLELVSSNSVHLFGIDTLVLDEADKMLNLDFKDELNKFLHFYQRNVRIFYYQQH